MKYPRRALPGPVGNPGRTAPPPVAQRAAPPIRAKSPAARARKKMPSSLNRRARGYERRNMPLSAIYTRARSLLPSVIRVFISPNITNMVQFSSTVGRKSCMGLFLLKSCTLLHLRPRSSRYFGNIRWSFAKRRPSVEPGSFSFLQDALAALSSSAGRLDRGSTQQRLAASPSRCLLLVHTPARRCAGVLFHDARGIGIAVPCTDRR